MHGDLGFVQRLGRWEGEIFVYLLWFSPFWALLITALVDALWGGITLMFALAIILASRAVRSQPMTFSCSPEEVSVLDMRFDLRELARVESETWGTVGRFLFEDKEGKVARTPWVKNPEGVAWCAQFIEHRMSRVDERGTASEVSPALERLQQRISKGS